VVEVRNVYPRVSPLLLDCDQEPVPGEILTDVALAKFTESVRVAGLSCRQKLSTIKALVATWPK
jgi:hypothetical protein